MGVPGKQLPESLEDRELDGAAERDIIRTYRQTVSETASFIFRISLEFFTLSLPEIHEELQHHLRKTEKQIEDLPKPPSNDPFSEVLHLIGEFTRSLARHLEGTPAPDGLIQTIRPMQIQFQRAIRATAPDFRPYARSEAATRNLPEASFLENEERFEARPEDNGKEIFIDEVFERAQMWVISPVYAIGTKDLYAVFELASSRTTTRLSFKKAIYPMSPNSGVNHPSIFSMQSSRRSTNI